MSEAVKRFVIPDEPAPTAPTPAPAASEATPAQNTGDQATPATPDAKPEEPLTPEQEAKRAGRRFERKLDKAYKARAEAQARAEFLQKELETARQASAPKAPDGEPRLEQFDFDPEKYAAAKAEFAKTQTAKDFETKQRQETMKAEHQRLVSSWEEKAERGADKYDDWQETVGELQLNSPFVAAIMEADNGDDIAHYLGKHAKDAQRIAALPPLSQAREIGKLEAKLLLEPVKPKTPSKAPAPITPLTGVAQVATDVPSEEDDMATWIKKRQRQVYGKRKF